MDEPATSPALPDQAGRDRRLAWLLAAFAVLVACTQVGAITAPTLVKDSPELLLALSSRIRHLLFAVPAGINPVAYTLIAFVRLGAAAWLCYSLGRHYGDRGMAWIERQVQGDTPATFRWLQRAADKGGPALVFFMPGSNIVCALVGQRRMPVQVFGLCLTAGIAFRLAWVWAAARAFDSELKSILDWIERYQWWLVGAFFVITVLQSARKSASAAKSGAPPPLPPPPTDDRP